MEINPKGGFPLPRNFYVRTDSKFTCLNVKVARGSTSSFTHDPPYIASMIITRVNEIEAMYERPRVNINVERGSSFTYSRAIPYIVYATVEIHLKLTERVRSHLKVKKNRHTTDSWQVIINLQFL